MGRPVALTTYRTWECVDCGQMMRPCLCGYQSCTKQPRHIHSAKVKCDPKPKR